MLYLGVYAIYARSCTDTGVVPDADDQGLIKKHRHGHARRREETNILVVVGVGAPGQGKPFA